MKLKHLFVLTFTFFASTLCGQSVKITTEKDVDLTVYETFTVIKGEVVTPPDGKKANPETLFQAIKKGVVREMEERGYKFQEDSTAQLRVSYVTGSYSLTNVGNSGPLGQTPASSPSDINQSRSWSHTSSEGMLVLDISDAANKKPLWKAEANNVGLDGVDVTHALDAVIYKAFKKFPNKLKKKKK